MINFIGIGAQKCASSWIYEVLRNSPQACLSDVKELDFFSYYYDKGYEWYESNFSNLEKSVVGEISPSYFYNSDVPQRVFDYNKDMKIVLSLRDPIKRMFSNHLHEVRAGNITGENIKFENAFNNNPLYFIQSSYAEHLKKWMQYFTLDNIHVVFQENVKNNPQKVSNDLCQFLDIDQLELMEVSAVNASLQNKNPIIGSMFEFGGDILRTLKLKNVLNDLKETSLLGGLYNKNKLHISEIVEPIEVDFKNQLLTQLKEPDQELKEILGMTELPWELK
ncbi:sulfotransferase domain-containing protein [Aliiglaciecola sp. 2_MG-2023]|uniref:sulfotransferase domain-containing protein n=1 Tax=unclassified Aliiglaciecola TaxID=2593648 RepID=UPI0026E1A9D1|nr:MULTISPECIES: sulfotransferase domain-containing protein [unclassified Aliiglaciecola]MDO6712207.1 sulfotransferase domain-containing protein [Aliiglaciecola sp. 2_MG-2023]MDO6753555.1 sulfotransferase domain-containing protein [Aliiglaciecola sp. 1_MG-2023]